MNSKNVWDVDDFDSLKDLLRDKQVSKAMLGRAFAILGIKGEELGDELKAWKARIVFPGSIVRTKTGTSAADLFEEVSNAPASFCRSPSCRGRRCAESLFGHTARRRNGIPAGADRHADQDAHLRVATARMVAR